MTNSRPRTAIRVNVKNSDVDAAVPARPTEGQGCERSEEQHGDGDDRDLQGQDHVRSGQHGKSFQDGMK